MQVNTVQQFVEACKSLNSDEIYELFENKISQDLRDEIYTYSRPYAETVQQNLAGTHTFEPCRDAMQALGLQYDVESLLNY